LTETIKYSTDKNTGERLDYPPRLKLNLAVDTHKGGFQTKFFDMKKQPMDINEENACDQVPRRSTVYPIIKVTGCWSSRLGSGLRMSLFQARIKKQSLENCCLYGDVSDESDTEAQEPQYCPIKREHSDDEDMNVKRAKHEDVEFMGSDSDKENIGV